MVSLMVLVPERKRRGGASGLISLTCSTDNQGNSFILDRPMTTCYPLGVILMELAHQMKLRRMLLRARWAPRLQNQEADDLTNDEFRHFDPKKRIAVELADLKFKIMDRLFEVGDEYIKDLEATRASEKRKSERKPEGGKADRPSQKQMKPLCEKEPW